MLSILFLLCLSSLPTFSNSLNVTNVTSLCENNCDNRTHFYDNNTRCFCDYDCIEYNDCCNNFEHFCTTTTLTTTLTTTQTTTQTTTPTTTPTTTLTTTVLATMSPTTSPTTSPTISPTTSPTT